MTFLQPGLLYGLLALAIPIIIHLFNFRRAKKVYFSNTQLLKNVKQVTKAKLKLKHWLILLSRLFFVLFLVLAFAQPFLPSSENLSHSNEVLIYLDNSQSMSNEMSNGEVLLDVAIKSATEIVDKYPTDAKFKLLLNDGTGARTFLTKQEISDKITEVQLSSLSRTVQEMIRKFALAQNQSGAARQFYISDFQESTSGELAALDLDTISSYSIVKIGDGKQGNVFVDSIYLEKPFLRSTDKNKLFAVLSNAGNTKVADIVIKLSIEGLQVSTATATIPARGQSIVPFDLSLDLQRFNRGQISIEDFPVTFDNEFYFSLSTGQLVSIMEIKPNSDESVIEKVFANPSLFKFNSYSIGNISYNEIENTNLVILNGLPEIESSLIPYLRKFMQSGGQLMVVPAADLAINTYGTLLSGIGLKLSNKERESLASPDLRNPFYQNIFDTKNRKFEMPTVSPVIKWGRRGVTLLRFKSGDAALARFNNGSMYVWSSPFEDAFTSMHKHAVFVPIMYRIATSSLETTERLHYDVNETVISAQLDSLQGTDIYELEKEGRTLIPEQRINGKELVLELPKELIEPGFYELKLRGAIKKVLAFNPANTESMLEAYNKEELVDLMYGRQNVTVYAVDDAKLFGNEVKKAQFGTELWKYCLWLCLFFLLVEVLLIRLL